MMAKIIVNFYKFWHGALHLKGAGRLISWLAPLLKDLQNYPLELPNGQVITVDFRELSAFGCLNEILGDVPQEVYLIDAICSHLNNDSVFWDIGANAGLLSYSVTDRQKISELRFFEPNPKLFPWASSALANLPHAKGHQLGISNKTGHAVLHVPLNKSAYGSLTSSSDGGEDESFEVETCTADSLVYDRGYRPPHVVKIDTEGHEPAVIQGMKRILREHRPIVFFEHVGITDTEVMDMIPDGYELKTVSNSIGKFTPAFSREAGHNSVFLPVGKIPPD